MNTKKRSTRAATKAERRPRPTPNTKRVEEAPVPKSEASALFARYSEMEKALKEIANAPVLLTANPESGRCAVERLQQLALRGLGEWTGPLTVVQSEAQKREGLRRAACERMRETLFRYATKRGCTGMTTNELLARMLIDIRHYANAQGLGGAAQITVFRDRIWAEEKPL